MKPGGRLPRIEEYETVLSLCRGSARRREEAMLKALGTIVLVFFLLAFLAFGGLGLLLGLIGGIFGLIAGAIGAVVGLVGSIFGAFIGLGAVLAPLLAVLLIVGGAMYLLSA